MVRSMKFNVIRRVIEWSNSTKSYFWINLAPPTIVVVVIGDLSLICVIWLIYIEKQECVYTLYVKTGSIIRGGTDSNISVILKDAKNHRVGIPNLKAWGGAMGEGHNYLERGNLDVFTGRGPCIGSPVCKLNLASDGSGSHHSWFCDYVEVISTGPHKPCSKTVFVVNQWLSQDVPPYTLTALIDRCRVENLTASSHSSSSSTAQY